MSIKEKFAVKLYDLLVNNYGKNRPDFISKIIPPSWLPAYDIPFILELEENLVGIEIGVSHGYSTNFLLEFLPNLHIHCIDPYVEYVQMSDTKESLASFEILREKYPNQITFHQKSSDNAVDDFENESVDFIFIDGLHTYEQVKKDIENYYPKIKKEGYIFGHDYGGWSAESHNVKRTGATQGVNTAVDELAKKYDKTVSFCNQDVWYWKK